ncbi:MAG: hypothetical protein ACT4PL_12815 [Phycisphaerales bacterium]
MSGGAGSSKLTALLGKLRAADARRQGAAVDSQPTGGKKEAEQAAAGAVGTTAAPMVAADPVLTELMRSVLMEDTTAEKVELAMVALGRAFVDSNELRVSTVDEVASALGRTLPGPAARATRLKEALREVYKREHTLALARLESVPKREAMAYLLAITTPFAAHRTALVALGVHQIPADEPLTLALVSAGILPAGSAPSDATTLLNKTVRPAEGPEAYRLLQGWVAAQSTARAAREPRSARAKRTGRPRAAGAKAGRAR